VNCLDWALKFMWIGVHPSTHMRLEEGIVKATTIAVETSRNLELVMAYLVPDVILQPPDQPMVVGREAVREFYAGWFAMAFTAIQAHAQRVTVASSSDLAYLVGESSLVLSGPQGEHQVPGKHLGVWRKVDGEWRLTAMSWTGNVVSGKG
jgi:ketosteroid isomerase-like protein